jgi:hypothetical protein
MNDTPTSRTDADERMAWGSEYMVPPETARELERELTAMTAQRDRLAEEVGQLKSRLTQTIGAVTISRNGYVQELEQQRDRLAEAVNAATILIAAKGRHNTMLAYNGLRDALQSLAPKP